MNEYEKKMPALLKTRKEKIFVFVKQNPDNEACATIPESAKEKIMAENARRLFF